MATISTGKPENCYSSQFRLIHLTLEAPLKVRMISAAVVALVALVAAGCGGASDTKDATAASGGGGGAKLSLVAYSTPQVVYDELAPKFAATAAGEGTSFNSSYGGSG